MKGLGGIVNDPEGTILTRKALGRLSTGGLLVNNKGLNINNDGQFSFSPGNSGGLSDEENGLSVSRSPNGSIGSGSNGLYVKTKSGGYFRIVSGELQYNPSYSLFLTTTDTFVMTFTSNWSDYQTSLPGVRPGDSIVVSPVVTPSTFISSWGAFCDANDIVTLRVSVWFITFATYPQEWRFIVLS